MAKLPDKPTIYTIPWINGQTKLNSANLTSGVNNNLTHLKIAVDGIIDCLGDIPNNSNIENGTGDYSLKQASEQIILDHTIAPYRDNVASGYDAVALGYGAEASNHASIALGEGPTASGRNAFACNDNTEAIGRGSHAEGKISKGIGMYTHAEGSETSAGFNDQTVGTVWGDQASHAEGYQTVAKDRYTHAEGYATLAGHEGTPTIDLPNNPGTENFQYAEGAHAEGYQTKATICGAHSEGVGTKATGYASHASGTNTVAKHVNSSSFGTNTVTGYPGQTVVGEYNVETTNAYFVVGKGTSTSARSNAFEVYKDGHAELAMQGTTNKSVVIKESVTTDLRKGTGARSIIQIHGAQANEASGQSAIALGMGNKATATRAVTIGEGLIGNVSNTTYVGKYNDNSVNNTLFVVGNGTSTSARSNALKVYKDGHAEVGSMGSTNNSIATKQYVDNKSNLTEITWAALKALRDGGNLVPGMQYRITDYQCTTTTANTSSAGHQFDIIVTADSTNALNEKARAALHSGDTYFANSELDAWELWYSLDNNAIRFEWALFNYIEVQLSSYNKVKYYRAAEFDDLSKPYGYAWLRIPDTLQRKVYTNTDTPTLETKAYSSMSGEDESYDINIVNNEEGKGVIYRMIDEFGNDVPYDFKNILFTKSEKYTNVYTFAYTVDSTIKDVSLLGLDRGCYLNVIKKFISPGSMRQSLNFNVFYSTGGTFQCYGNIFERCRSNTFSGDNHYNMLGNDCSGNTFGTQCSYNTLGMGCSNNTFGRSCTHNIFGDACSNNTYEMACSDNTFGNGCSNNTFGRSFSNNTFGSGCSNNTFGSNCRFDTFGNDCRYIVFGDSSSTVDYCQNIIIDNGCKYLYINSTDTTASSSNYLQNAHVHLGISGSSSSNRLTLTVPDRALAYETEFAKNGSTKIVVE